MENLLIFTFLVLVYFIINPLPPPTCNKPTNPLCEFWNSRRVTSCLNSANIYIVIIWLDFFVVPDVTVWYTIYKHLKKYNVCIRGTESGEGIDTAYPLPPSGS